MVSQGGATAPKPSASPQRSRNTYSASSSSGSSSGRGSGSGSGRNSSSTRQLRVGYDDIGAHDRTFASSTSDVPLVGFAGSVSYEGGRLPSLIGSLTSSRGSVVASLNENFIANSHNSNPNHHHNKRPNGVPNSADSDASSSYVDHCGWAASSIEADTPDTRMAITRARGEKKSKQQQQQLPATTLRVVAISALAANSNTVENTRQSSLRQSAVLNATSESVNNPLALPRSSAASPLAVGTASPKGDLADPGRKRSVRITAPPDPPTPTKNAPGRFIAGKVPSSGAGAQLPPMLHRQQLLQQQDSSWAMQRHIQQQQQQIVHMQMLQKMQSQRFVPPPPVYENFAQGSQRTVFPQAKSPLNTSQSAMEHSLMSESPLTNSNAANGSTTTTTPTTTPMSQQSKSSQVASPTRRRGFFFCGGKKEEVAADNRST